MQTTIDIYKTKCIKCIRHSKRATIKLVNILFNEQPNMQIAQKSIRSSMIEQRQLCVMNTKSFFSLLMDAIYCNFHIDHMNVRDLQLLSIQSE